MKVFHQKAVYSSLLWPHFEIPCRRLAEIKPDVNSSENMTANYSIANSQTVGLLFFYPCVMCEILLSCWKRKPLIQTAPSVVMTVAPMICHGSRSAQRVLICRLPSSRYSRSISLYTSKALWTHRHVKSFRMQNNVLMQNAQNVICS